MGRIISKYIYEGYIRGVLKSWGLPANKSKSTTIWDRQSCRLSSPTDLTRSWRRWSGSAVAVDRDYWIMVGGTMCLVCLCLCHKKKVVPWLEGTLRKRGAGNEGELKRGAVRMSKC